MPQEPIDPRLDLPPFVNGVRYYDTDSGSGEPEQVAEVTGLTSINADDSAQPADDLRLLPPDYMTVISQTARVTPGGMVVDVVIDVQDTAGTGQVEVRVSI